MNGHDALLERVRRADPVDAFEVLDWSTSETAQRMLDTVARTTVVPLPAPRRRRAVRLAIVAVAITSGVTAAAAAAGVLGRSAPDRVREHLASLDEGMPDDLRLNPDLDHVRAVAATASGVLYAADLRDGGYCLEVVTDGDRPRGAACVTAAHLGDRAIAVTAPIPSEPAGALLVGGRINDEQVEQVVASYPSGQRAEVALGLERYWLLEVPATERDDALSRGLAIVGTGADGHEVVTLAVPPLRDEDPLGTKLDRLQPIFVSTISTGTDLTLVLGVEGSLNVAGAATLELTYPDGTTVTISVEPDGTYRFLLPADRQDDFATSSGRLIARDAAGEIVATTPVSSVARSRASP